MEARVVQALELLDEVGVATPSIGVTLSSAASASGITRSTLYRHWSTAADLNADLAVIAACHLPGWTHRVLDASPEEPLDQVVAHAVGGRADIGTAIRALVAGWGSDAEARVAIAGWEHDWLDRFGRWVEAHVVASGRAFAGGATRHAAAVGLAATVEGWLIARTLEGAHDQDEVLSMDPLRERVRLLIDQMTEPAPVPQADVSRPAAGADPTGAPGPPPYADARLALARRIIEACADPATGRWSAEPTRLVDLERLARRLDVSPRWLYELWPTASEMNTAVVEGWFARDRREIDEAATAWLSEIDPAVGRMPSRRFTQALDDSLRRRVGKAQANQFTMSHAAADPEVRVVLDRIQGEYRVLVRLMYLAALSIAGWQLRPGTSVDDYTALMFETNLGLDRLVALHPELLDLELDLDGEPHPFCGAVHLLVGRSATFPVDS